MSLNHGLKPKKDQTPYTPSSITRAKGRLIFAGFIIFIGLSAVLFRLGDLTLVNFGNSNDILHEDLYATTENDKNFAGERAPIYDSNGILLAHSMQVESLYADATLVADPKKTAQELKELFPEIDVERLAKKLDSKNRFVWVKRHLSPDEFYKANKYGHKALSFKKEYKRLYPLEKTMSHILGYTNVDNKGITGLERGLDDRITTNPEPLYLSINSKIQHILNDEIQKAIDKFDAKAGGGIVLNAKTGEIVALSSLPSFNPQHPFKAKENEKFNRATLGVFEMGSTFKLFSAAAALESPDISIQSTFDCRKPIKYGRFTITDFHAQKRIMSVPEIFMHSSNIGHVKMAEKVGAEQMQAFYHDLGFFDRIKTDIPETGAPLTPKPWRKIHTATTSYGHGIAVSPLHVASAAASVLNGGIAVTPRFTKTAPDILSDQKRVVSQSTSNYLREMMRLTVLNGTGKNADVDGYLVGGKTGTSEKAKAGSYSKKSLISSFLGAFPMNNPEFIVYIMVDEPIGNQASYGYATGGWVAAPAVKNTIMRMSSILGIPPLSQTDINRYDSSMAVKATIKQ